MGLPQAEKKYYDMLSRLDTIPERDRRAGGQNSYLSIARQQCCAVLTRDKNDEVLFFDACVYNVVCNSVTTFLCQQHYDKTVKAVVVKLS